MRYLYNINEIVQIISGYTIRERILETETGSIRILQAKNIQDTPRILIDDLARCDIHTSHTAAFVKDCDVAIGSRGVFRAAVVWTEEKVLAISSVYLLRIRDQNAVLPEYLATYFNSAAGQKKLSPHLTTGTIRTLPKRGLESIEIPLPSMDQQKIIVRLTESVREQGRILNDKIRIQKNIVNGIIEKMEMTAS